MFLLIALIFFFCLPSEAMDQPGSWVPGADSLAHQQSLQPDTTAINVRLPEDLHLLAYRDNPDYIYIRKENPVDSWWDLFQRWLKKTMFDAVSGERWDLFWKLLQGALLGGILVIGVMQLLRMEAGKLFYGNRAAATTASELFVADIKRVDFLHEAEAAISQGQYRQAVRFYYLQVLKTLDADGLIQWAPQKTNQDYVRECKDPGLREQLIRLTYLFDYAWYGEFDVEDIQLKQVQDIVSKVTKERRRHV